MVWTHFERSFHVGDHVLELGCGTGEDALALARRGITVTAIDASESMVERARAKARRFGLEEHIELEAISMELAPAMYRGRLFDGIFSNFGAINCVSDYATLAAGLARLLRPGAPLIWVVMGRHVPWEWAWQLAHGQWRKSWRRLEPSGTDWRGIHIEYPTPGELAESLQPHFTVEQTHPLGWALPPSYAAGWLNRHPRTLKAVTRIERGLHGSGLLARLADHYIIRASRTPRP